MPSETEQSKSAAKQLLDLAAAVESPKTEISDPEGRLSISLEADVVEGDLLAQNLLATLQDSESFIHRKSSSRFPDHRGDDDTLWAQSVAWQLLPDAQYRTTGLATQFQDQREQRVVELLKQDQPLTLDLGVWWIAATPDVLQLSDLAAAQNIVGLLDLLQHERSQGSPVTAQVKLTIAPQPGFPISPAAVETYATQFRELITALSAQKNLDTQALSLTITSINQLSERTDGETEARLIQQLFTYWQESETVFTAILQEKRQRLGSATATWKEITQSTWKFMPHPGAIDQDFQVFLRRYYNAIGSQSLAPLLSYQALDPRLIAEFGWFTPNCKEALLRHTATITNLADPTAPYTDLMQNETLVKAALTHLVQKFLLTKTTQPAEATLRYQFGQPLPDVPLQDVVYLKPWGNLSFEKALPWEKPLVVKHVAGKNLTPNQVPTPAKNLSTPQLHELSLSPPVDLVGVHTTATMRVGDCVVEAPVVVVPTTILLDTIRRVMKGQS